MNKRFGLGLSPLTNEIYLGTIKTYKDGHEEWADDKETVTREAVIIVANHLKKKIDETSTTYTVVIDGKHYLMSLKEDPDTHEDLNQKVLDGKEGPKMATQIGFWNTEGREAYSDETEFNTTDENELAKLWWDFCMEEGIIDYTREVEAKE